MDTLPEELLTQIISHIHDVTINAPSGPHPYPDTATLYALCLTSRKFLRIAKPYLYTSIHSTSGEMGKSLYRVLLSDSQANLRPHIREFAVQHTHGGCFDVDNKFGFRDEEFGRTFDVCQNFFQRTIDLLPNIEVLDLSRFPPTDKENNVWLTKLRELYFAGGTDWYGSMGFASVQRLSLHLGSMSGEEIWVVFRLPNLKELEIDVRKSGHSSHWSRERQDAQLWASGTSNVETLRIVGLHNWCGRIHELVLMSRACKALRSIFVSVPDLDTSRFVPQIFEDHIHRLVLRQLQIAVVGLWHYELNLLLIEPGDDTSRLGEELITLMIYATGNYETDTENGFESTHMRITGMRELSPDEKRAYDVRLARRP